MLPRMERGTLNRWRVAAFACLAAVAAIALAAAGSAGEAQNDDGQASPRINQEEGVALHGYDVVSYFTSGAPVRGKAKHAVTHQGVAYRFASSENAERFRGNPDRYLPAYGGYCAYAMLDGEKVGVDPETYKRVDGRLLLFYHSFLNNTLASWNDRASRKSGDEALLERADANWRSIAKDNARPSGP